MKNSKRIKINVPSGVSPADLERICGRLYELSSGKRWIQDEHDGYGLIDYHCALNRVPDHRFGCMKFFDNIEVSRRDMLRMAVEMFRIPKDTAMGIFRKCVVSCDGSEYLVDFEDFLRLCANHNGHNRIEHGNSYHIYCHPFIRDFLSFNIVEFALKSEEEYGTSYRFEVGKGRKSSSLDITCKANCSLSGLVAGDYALMMAFWSCFKEGKGQDIALSAIWETMYRGRWSDLKSNSKVDYKKMFFERCLSFKEKMKWFTLSISSMKLNGKDVKAGQLFGTIEVSGGYELDSKGEKVYDHDKVTFRMSRPELLYMSGNSVITVPEGMKSTMTGGPLHIYLAYRILRYIRLGGKKASSTILARTLDELFGEWSRKSAKNYMERLVKAGVIKSYIMSRRGIEFDAVEDKNNEKKENEDE